VSTSSELVSSSIFEFSLDDGIRELIKGYQLITTFRDREFTNL